MTKAPFALVLVRKSARAMKGARLVLSAGDNDSAVSRSYYAMFDMARAALLRAGVTEDKLPRTHHGVLEAFRIHAVDSGRVNRQFAPQLSLTESLRIMADYTGTETELTEATEVVRIAEVFVQAVEPAFGLDEACLVKEYEEEELRRQARENRLQMQQQRGDTAKESSYQD